MPYTSEKQFDNGEQIFLFFKKARLRTPLMSTKIRQSCMNYQYYIIIPTIYIYIYIKKKKTQCQHVCGLLSAKTQIKVTIQQSMKERAFDSTREKSHYKLGYNKRILIVALHFRKTI